MLNSVAKNCPYLYLTKKDDLNYSLFLIVALYKGQTLTPEFPGPVTLNEGNKEGESVFRIEGTVEDFNQTIYKKKINASEDDIQKVPYQVQTEDEYIEQLLAEIESTYRSNKTSAIAKAKFPDDSRGTLFWSFLGIAKPDSLDLEQVSSVGCRAIPTDDSVSHIKYWGRGTEEWTL